MGKPTLGYDGLPKKIRKKVSTFVGALLDTLDAITDESIATLIEDGDEDVDEATHQYSVGYCACAADLAGMKFDAFVKKVGLDDGLIEEEDDA